MVRAVAAFLEFCYLVRRSEISETTLSQIENAPDTYYEERQVFIDEGVRDNISLPRQHSAKHYPRLIRRFGAPNGLCSSITESQHIRAVKEPWRRSNRNDPLKQMLLTNQRIDKLRALRVHLETLGLLPTKSAVPPPSPPAYPNAEENDFEIVGTTFGSSSLGDVHLPQNHGMQLILSRLQCIAHPCF